MYQRERIILDGRLCTVFYPEGAGPFPAVCLCSGDVESLAPVLLETSRRPVLYYHVDADWERDYTPWPAPGLPGRAAFTGEAGAYLRFLTETVRPALLSAYPVCREAAQHAITGYSLGGLFALWALFQTDAFGAAASLSGSLWYDGWLGYLETHVPPQDARVYLSLGRSEERTGNPRMAAVGENTRRTYEYLVKTLGEHRTALEWNRGGHFTGIPNRWRKAMDWLGVNFMPDAD